MLRGSAISRRGHVSVWIQHGLEGEKSIWFKMCVDLRTMLNRIRAEY